MRQDALVQYPIPVAILLLFVALDIQCRPKQVHVFINPVGGRKRAPQIYETFVAPLFELAGVTAAVTVTERANHALDKLQTMDLTGIDGFICVGGDGMFHEVLNGLLLRTQQDAGVIMERARFLPVRPRTCIGIVPAGMFRKQHRYSNWCSIHAGSSDAVSCDVAIVVPYKLGTLIVFISWYMEINVAPDSGIALYVILLVELGRAAIL